MSMVSKFAGSINTIDSELNAVLYTDNIIYCDSPFNGSSDLLNQNNGVLSSGFYVRSGLNWVNISNAILSYKVKSYNPSYLGDGLYIIGEDFTFNGISFTQRNAYFYDNGWEVDIRFKQPIISKLNFRYGKFKGTHNDGCFGTNLKKNNWDGAIWNSGVFLNSNWNSGTMNSKSSKGEIGRAHV